MMCFSALNTTSHLCLVESRNMTMFLNTFVQWFPSDEIVINLKQRTRKNTSWCTAYGRETQLVKAFGCRKSIAVPFVDRIKAFHVTAAQPCNDSNLNLGRGANDC